MRADQNGVAERVEDAESKPMTKSRFVTKEAIEAEYERIVRECMQILIDQQHWNASHPDQEPVDVPLRGHIPDAIMDEVERRMKDGSR